MSDVLDVLSVGELPVPEASAQTNSCFQEVDVKEHVTLLPSYLGKVGQGVLELLSSRVLHYNAVYNGVLLAFSHVRVLQSTGRILDELPHLHIDILYTATVFRPQVGEVMSGHINKVGLDHVGCLLYNCFNASVVCTAVEPHRGEISDGGLSSSTPEASTSKDSQSSKREKKKTRNEARNAPYREMMSTTSASGESTNFYKFRSEAWEEWNSRTFYEGEKVWFIVTKVEITGNILSLRGEYIATGVMEVGGEGRGGGGREGGGERVTGGEVVVNPMDNNCVVLEDEFKSGHKKSNTKSHSKRHALKEGEDEQKEMKTKRKRDSRKRKRDNSSETEGAVTDTERRKRKKKKIDMKVAESLTLPSGCDIVSGDVILRNSHVSVEGEERGGEVHGEREREREKQSKSGKRSTEKRKKQKLKSDSESSDGKLLKAHRKPKLKH